MTDDKLYYDYITEKNLPKTEDGLKNFQDDLEENGTFMLSLVEYLRYDKFGDDHLECHRLEDGRPRFGATGGGTLVSFIVDAQKHSVVVYCEGCDHEYEITEGKTNNNVYDEITSDSLPSDPSELEAFEKKAYWSRRFKLNEVEFLRYRQFKKDVLADAEKNFRTPGTITVSFCPTGLGSLVSVSEAGSTLRYDITDSSNW